MALLQIVPGDLYVCLEENCDDLVDEVGSFHPYACLILPNCMTYHVCMHVLLNYGLQL